MPATAVAARVVTEWADCFWGALVAEAAHGSPRCRLAAARSLSESLLADSGVIPASHKCEILVVDNNRANMLRFRDGHLLLTFSRIPSSLPQHEVLRKAPTQGVVQLIDSDAIASYPSQRLDP